MATPQYRVTVTLSKDRMDVLERIAEAMKVQRSTVAKQMLEETLDALQAIFSDVTTSDQAVRKMFKVSMMKMVDTIDELDKGGMS